MSAALRFRVAGAGLLAALVAAACAPATAAPATAPGPAGSSAGSGAVPARLSETGLFADLAAQTLAPGVLSFSPQYPLWSDGARKRRWIRLPAGAAIDASDPDDWSFPVGTRLWKEFALDRPIETRMLERTADGWTFAAYVWSADGADATLAPANGIPRFCDSTPGVPYDVPSVADCRACHLTSGRTPVLGFTALQLSDDRDPLAPHAEPPPPGAVTLSGLLERGLLRGLPARHLGAPPRIRATTPRGRAALGYLAANCGTCHAGGGPLEPLGLELHAPLDDAAYGALPALSTGVGRLGRYRMPGTTHDAPRIAPGAPELSTLLLRMRSRDPAVQMPPLGTHAVDVDALALLEAWVREDLAPRGTTQTDFVLR